MTENKFFRFISTLLFLLVATALVRKGAYASFVGVLIGYCLIFAKSGVTAKLGEPVRLVTAGIITFFALYFGLR